MEWFILIIVAGGVFVLGFRLGARTTQNNVKVTVNRERVAQAHDRWNLLNSWRREIANILIWEEPDQYITLYRTLHAETSKFKDWKSDVLHSKFDELSKKYPQYIDFDLIGTRTYILYPDARSTCSDDDLAAHYSDIVRFQALQTVIDPYWRFFSATSDEELNNLTKYGQHIKDTQFRIRLEKAIQMYEIHRAAKDETMPEFETPEVCVSPIWHFADARYGVHLKKTDEYGLYSVFYFDEIEKPPSRSFFRSDATFQTEQSLRILYPILWDRMPESREAL